MPAQLRNNLLLILVALIVVCTLLLAAGIRAVVALFAVPFVLLAPGYVTTLALFPGRTLRPLERALFSLGLSVAILAVGGLLLNLTPWGLSPGSWLGWIVAVTVGAGAIAARRGQGLLPAVAQAPSFRPATRDLVLSGVAAASIALALWIAAMPAPAEGNAGYTVMSMVPDQTAHPSSVRITLNSAEFATTAYHLQLKLNGQVVREWNNITLQPGEQWSENATWPPTSGNERVEALLYRASSPNDIYRYTLVQSRPEGN